MLLNSVETFSILLHPIPLCPIPQANTAKMHTLAQKQSIVWELEGTHNPTEHLTTASLTADIAIGPMGP